MDKERKFNTMCTDLFVVIIFAIFPLFVKDQYFDITEAKYMFMLVATCAYAIGLLVNGIIQKKLSCSFVKTAKLSITDYAILLFAVLQLLSARWSGIGQESLIGKQSRYMGAYTILVLVILYFLISRNFVFNKKMVYALAVSSAIVYGIAIVQNLGFDAFHFYEDILEGTEDQFLSTIGNNNFFASFVCVTYGFFMVLFCQAEQKVEKVTLGIVIMLGSMAVIASGNNGVFIGVMAVLLFISILVIFRRLSWKGFLDSIIVSLFGIIVIELLRKCFQNVKALDSLANGLNHPGIIAIIILVLGAVKFGIRDKADNLSDSAKKEIKIKHHWVLIVGGSSLLIFAVILLYILHIIRIPDAFGTGRGFIWNRLMESYQNTSLRNKLFGFGPETIGTIFSMEYAEETKAFIKLNVNAAHNEYLQYLITIGFVGLCSYIVFLVSIVWRGLYSSLSNRWGYAVIAMMLGYLAHASIGIAQPNTTPFLFIGAGMLEGLNRVFTTKVVNS